MTPLEEAEALRVTKLAAREVLFNLDGTPRGFEDYIFSVTFKLMSSEDRPFDTTWGPFNMDWLDAHLEAAKNGDYISDRIVCCAASLILGVTAGIRDFDLREYVACSLRRENRDLQIDTRTIRNAYRDRAICLRLVWPLVQRGFLPTRNPGTEAECAVLDREQGPEQCRRQAILSGA